MFYLVLFCYIQNATASVSDSKPITVRLKFVGILLKASLEFKKPPPTAHLMMP